jgi:hypothetical protein
MSRILKRPMFRTGGTPNEGIMNGIVDRKGYAQGDNPYIQEAKEAFSTIEQPRDTSLYEMLIGGGINVVSGAGAGEGLMSNLAKSYKGPSEKFFEAQRARGAYDSKIGQAATQAGLEQKWKMDQIAAQKGDENSPLYNVYLNQGVEQGMSGSEAERFAAYHTDLKEDLRQKVGGSRMGGIIEQDLNSLSPKKQKEFAKKNKRHIGKYFYDPYDGKIKQLVEQNGELGWIPFDSVDSIDFSPVSGVSTETSTPYQDEVEAREIEKQEGNILDEDIAAIRGY